MKLLLLLPIIFTLFFFVPQISYEHQDGCHRWHSCPSDSASYICGDLGFDNYCPDKELRDADEPKGMALMTTENIFLMFDADEITLEEGWVNKNGKQYIFDTTLTKKFLLSDDLEYGRIIGKTTDNNTFYMNWNLDKSNKLLIKVWAGNLVFKVIETIEDNDLFSYVEPQQSTETEIIPKSEVEQTTSSSSSNTSPQQTSNEDKCLAIVAKLFANLDPTPEELAEIENQLKENNCGDN